MADYLWAVLAASLFGFGYLFLQSAWSEGDSFGAFLFGLIAWSLFAGGGLFIAAGEVFHG